MTLESSTTLHEAPDQAEQLFRQALEAQGLKISWARMTDLPPEALTTLLAEVQAALSGGPEISELVRQGRD